MNLPIVQPSHPRLQEFDAYFDECLRTGQVTNGGKNVLEFEAKLSEYIGVPTICFNNATSALIAMLRAVDVQGRDVICPSLTFAATPQAIVLAGGRPLFCDVDPKTLCLDWVDAERKLTGRTSAILGVDPYGICWQPPKGWGDGHIDILVDSAPAFGSEIDGENMAKRGRAHVFSFHATKVFSTMEGGALCSDDTALIDRAKSIRNFGQNSDGDCEYIGFNGKMMEISAIIGLKQLETFEERLSQRLDSSFRLEEALDGINGVRVITAPKGQSPVWTYRPILIDEDKFGKSRDQVASELHLAGIQVRKYYRACNKLKCFYPPSAILPVSEMIASQVISLPLYDNMSMDECQKISRSLKEIKNS